MDSWFVEFRRKLDELDARMEQRWAAREQRGAAVEPHIGGHGQITATHVVADNWGGLFDEISNLSDEPSLVPAATVESIIERETEAVVTPDNWGGLFDQPTHTSEERSLVFPTGDDFIGFASSIQIRTADSKAEPVLPLHFGPNHVQYALPVKPVAPTWSSPLLAPHLFPCATTAAAASRPGSNIDPPQKPGFFTKELTGREGEIPFIDLAAPPHPTDGNERDREMGHGTLVELNIRDLRTRPTSPRFPAFVPASDKVLAVEEVDEKVVPSTDSEVLKAVDAQSNADIATFERALSKRDTYDYLTPIASSAIKGIDPMENPLQIQEQLEVVEADEKILSEALKADGSALDGNCYDQGALSTPPLPRRAALRWPRLGRLWHLPLCPLRPCRRRRRRAPLRPLRLHRQWRAPPRPPRRARLHLPPLRPPRRALLLGLPRRLHPRPPRPRRPRPPWLCRPLSPRTRGPRRARPWRGRLLRRHVWRPPWRLASRGRRPGRHGCRVGSLTSGPACGGTAPSPTPTGGAEVSIVLVAPPRLSSSARVFTSHEYAPVALGAVYAHAVDADGYARTFSTAASANSAAVLGLLLVARLPCTSTMFVRASGSASKSAMAAVAVLSAVEVACDITARYCATDVQLVIECKARQDAHLVFDKMPRRYNTVIYPSHCNGIVLSGQEAREVFEELAKLLSEILWPPPMHMSNQLVLYWKHRQWPPPTELQLVSFVPRSSFNMVGRCSVRCYCHHLWKPPWPIQICQCEVVVTDYSISNFSCCVFDHGDLHTCLDQHYIASKYALQLSVDGGFIQSLPYLSGVTYKSLWLLVFFQYISNCHWPSTAHTYELPMFDITWEEDRVLPLPPLRIWHDFVVHSVGSDYGPSVVPSSRVPLAWDPGGLEQIIYSWNLFIAHFEWYLAISRELVSSNQWTCKCSAMFLELPWLFCWDGFFSVSNEQTGLPVTSYMLTSRCIELQPWPSPAMERHDKEKEIASGFTVFLCLSHTSTYNTMTTTSIISVDWKIQRRMSGNHVCCHDGLLFIIRELQVPWDPGGSAMYPLAWGQAKAQGGGNARYHFILCSGIILLVLGTYQHLKKVSCCSFKQTECWSWSEGQIKLNKDCIIVILLHKIARAHKLVLEAAGGSVVLLQDQHPRSAQRLEGKPQFKEGGMSAPADRWAPSQQAQPGRSPSPAQLVNGKPHNREESRYLSHQRRPSQGGINQNIRTITFSFTYCTVHLLPCSSLPSPGTRISGIE